MAGTEELTLLLERWRLGDRDALDRLFPLVYGELKKNAKSVLLLNQVNATLSSTEIANETYLRLAKLPMGENHRVFQNRKQFYGLAQKAMLHILIDQVRRKKTAKHGGQYVKVVLSDENIQNEEQDHPTDTQALESALEELRRLKQDWYQIVHMRFLEEPALTVQQTAKTLGLSVREIYRKSNLTMAWLRRRLVHQGSLG